MEFDQRWDRLGEKDWSDFAAAWLTELRSSSGDSGRDIRGSVIWLHFSARPEHQWTFIRAAIGHAESDADLCHIAAGPMEDFLVDFGGEYIDAVEQLAAIDPKFARALTGVWQNKIPDAVWFRIQALQERVTEPL